MKALLINPFDMTITEVEYDGDYKTIYKLISPPGREVRAFDAVRIKGDDTIWVDDEGLFQPNNFFEHEDYPSPLAGLGLVLGSTPDGDSGACNVTLDQLKAKVNWATPFRVNGQEDIKWVRINALKMEQEGAEPWEHI